MHPIAKQVRFNYVNEVLYFVPSSTPQTLMKGDNEIYNEIKKDRFAQIQQYYKALNEQNRNLHLNMIKLQNEIEQMKQLQAKANAHDQELKRLKEEITKLKTQNQEKDVIILELIGEECFIS